MGQVEYSVMVIGAEYFSLCCHAGQRKPLLPAEHPSLHRNLLAYLMKMKVCLLQAPLLPPQHQLLQHPTSNLGKEGFRESMHLCVPCYTHAVVVCSSALCVVYAHVCMCVCVVCECVYVCDFICVCVCLCFCVCLLHCTSAVHVQVPVQCIFCTGKQPALDSTKRMNLFIFFFLVSCSMGVNVLSVGGKKFFGKRECNQRPHK